MFRARRLHRLYRDRAFDGFDSFANPFQSATAWTRPDLRRGRRRRGPSIGLILLAGLAGLALMKLMSAAERPRRSTLEKVLIGLVLVAAAGAVLRLRRSARRYS